MLKSFANDLKMHREENNISLREVSAKTRLNISVLESLESGDYNFQPQAYIRAFMKQYIEAIGLDLDEVLFDYDLARSGKYKPKRENISYDSEEKPSTDIKIEVSESKPSEIKRTITEKLKKVIESPKADSDGNKSESPESSLNKITGSEISKKIENEKISLPEDKPKNKFFINTANPKSEKKSSPVNPLNTGSSFSFVNSPVFKNIFVVLIGALIVAGLYSLINIIFIEGGNKNPEVQRQNFDDVVNEQERKILGKRSPEEIQDSIRKAQEELASLQDTVKLTITATGNGTMYLVTDSSNYSSPDKIDYVSGQIGNFKAHKSFHISSANTESFKATLNGKPLKFENKSVSKVKVTKDGVKNN
jgi:transcriptional regulator with XRE-family HTH domain